MTWRQEELWPPLCLDLECATSLEKQQTRIIRTSTVIKDSLASHLHTDWSLRVNVQSSVKVISGWVETEKCSEEKYRPRHRDSESSFINGFIWTLYFITVIHFQSDPLPLPSAAAVPTERCQPTPVSHAHALPVLWDSLKVVWSGSRSLTVAKLQWVVTAPRR